MKRNFPNIKTIDLKLRRDYKPTMKVEDFIKPLTINVIRKTILSLIRLYSERTHKNMVANLLKTEKLQKEYYMFFREDGEKVFMKDLSNKLLNNYSNSIYQDDNDKLFTYEIININ